MTPKRDPPPTETPLTIPNEQFVARYIERSPLSLEKLSIQDDIVSYTTKDGAAHEFDPLEFLAALSVHIPKTYESITRYYCR
jgi:hypothetical protein